MEWSYLSVKIQPSNSKPRRQGERRYWKTRWRFDEICCERLFDGDRVWNLCSGWSSPILGLCDWTNSSYESNLLTLALLQGACRWTHRYSYCHYFLLFVSNPVGWACKIRQLDLYRGLWPPTPTSVLDMTLNCTWLGGSSPGAFRNVGYPSLPLLQGLLCPRVVVPDRVISTGQIKLFDHLTVWKQIPDVKLNC